jgi:hypothetical protein
MAANTAFIGMALSVYLLQVTAPLAAHHAFASEFDGSKPVDLTGTVTKMEWLNPHVWVHLEVKRPNGMLEAWAFEAGSPNVLFRRGFSKESLKPGVDVRITGYLARDGSRRANGHNMTFVANGKTLFMGSSGTGAPYEVSRPGIDVEPKSTPKR